MPKILIVDDEPFNVDYIEQELEDTGYETISAVNGQEALEKIHRQEPDLVLLDIMMPVMDGFEVLRRLKADLETRELPVIVISASSDLSLVVRGIQLGAEDYLPKPFEPTLLHARITSGLEKKHLRDLQKMYMKSLERELEIGHEIQLGFLPREIPNIKGWDVAAYFKSAREVAGDYYDVFILPDGNPVCVIGDVCGKGVGAALYMSLFRSLIRSTSKTETLFVKTGDYVMNNAERIHNIIAYTNQYVSENHGHTSMFSTVVIGIIDLQTNKLTYINGGNEPAILLDKHGGVTLLWPTGPIVGVIPGAEYQALEIAMEMGDLLLIYTDGVTDAMNADEIAFGRERLVELLQSEQAKGATCHDLLNALQQRLWGYIGQADQFDDISVLALRSVADH